MSLPCGHHDGAPLPFAGACTAIALLLCGRLHPPVEQGEAYERAAGEVAARGHWHAELRGREGGKGERVAVLLSIDRNRHRESG